MTVTSARRTWRPLVSVSAAICLMVTAAAADELHLKNGDRFTGTVEHLVDGTLTFKTAHGTLAVPWSEVTTLTIEEGTRIEGLPNSALFILRGVTIAVPRMLTRRTQIGGLDEVSGADAATTSSLGWRPSSALSSGRAGWLKQSAMRSHAGTALPGSSTMAASKSTPVPSREACARWLSTEKTHSSPVQMKGRKTGRCSPH